MTKMRAPFYSPDSTQATQQYNSPPLRKYEVRIDGVDRSRGQMFSFEGDTIFFERVDWPVLVSFVTANDTVQTAIVARAGLVVTGKFKNISLVHPLLSGANIPLAVRFSIGQNGSSENIPISITAFNSAGVSLLTTSATAVQFTAYLAVPPGARVLQNLDFVVANTTITQATLAAFGLQSAPGAFLVVSSPAYADEVGNAYAGFPSVVQLDATATVVTGTTRLRTVAPIALFCYTRILQINVVGTGLGANSNFNAVWQ